MKKYTPPLGGSKIKKETAACRGKLRCLLGYKSKQSGSLHRICGRNQCQRGRQYLGSGKYKSNLSNHTILFLITQSEPGTKGFRDYFCQNSRYRDVYFESHMEIYNDKGSNLVSELIRNVYRLLNIKQSNSLPYVPR